MLMPSSKLDKSIKFEVLFCCNSKIYCTGIYLLTDHFAPSYGNHLKVSIFVMVLSNTGMCGMYGNHIRYSLATCLVNFHGIMV